MLLTKTFRWHPQPSSIRKSMVAAKRFGMRGGSILDCFCGIGTHAVASIAAGAIKYIGTDIEDYSDYLRKSIARHDQKYQGFGERAVTFEWGIDAYKAIETIPHDILFIDPPNPYQIAGGSTISTLRDTGLSGSGLEKFWKVRFNDNNWIKQKEDTIKNVARLMESDIATGHRVLVNLFVIKSNHFDYFDAFKEEFLPRQIYESYYEVF